MTPGIPLWCRIQQEFSPMRFCKTVFATILIGATLLWQPLAWSQFTTAITVRGFVRDAAGNALKGDVTLIQGTSKRVVRNIQATPEGYYEAVLSLPGPATLIAKAPGFSSQTHSLEGNRAERFDFALRKPITVVGRVVAPGGVPIADARVRVRYPDSLEVFQFAQEVGDVTTDAQGNFSLAFVRPFSRFVLEVEASGYQLRKSRDFFSRDLPLTATVQLQRGATIRGRIVDDSGAPIANAFVTLRPAGNGSRGSPFPDAVTNTTTSANGEFVFSGLASRGYGIVVRKQGFKPLQHLDDLSSPDDNHFHRLTLKR
jgi:Carboxypeptidase regulatory-like domain